MPFILRAACLLLAGVALIFPRSASADTGPEQRPPTTRQALEQPPPKNCTRYNGHFGFYGNPWCTPEEQTRWDRWEARRLTAR